jgi:hypothetical protein
LAVAVVLVAPSVILVTAPVVLVAAPIVILIPTLVPALVAGTTRLEAAALFAGLVLGADTGANADGLSALGEGCAASGGTVGRSEALSADELDASSVSDVLVAGRVWDALAG